MTDGSSVQGYLHSIDPESGTLALLTPNQVHLLPSSTITSIQAGTLSEAAPTQVSPKITPFRGIEKQRLLDGLRKRHIEAEIIGMDIQIFAGLAVINPPYGPHCVRCVNENVLLRVRKVVDEIAKEDDAG